MAYETQEVCLVAVISSTGLTKKCGQTWNNRQPTPGLPTDTKSKCNGAVMGGGKMSRHTLTNGNTWQILNTLREEPPTEKLDWPIFCGSRKNKGNTKKKKN